MEESWFWKKYKSLRVSISILDSTEVSLQPQKDPGVPSAAVLQQGGSGLPGGLRGSALEGHGCEENQDLVGINLQKQNPNQTNR